MNIWNISFEELEKIIEKHLNNFNISNSENFFKEDLKWKKLAEIRECLKNNNLLNLSESKSFNKRLKIKWWELFCRLEEIIDFSFFSIKEWQDHIDKSNIKNDVLIKLHARLILLSREILTLLQNWFWEWANARWRSLYETSVIIKFISDNNNDVSLRFTEHKSIYNYKEAENYKKHYKRLRHKSYWSENLKNLEVEKNTLLKKYWKSFLKDYWWIPDEISKNKNFSQIEKLVDMFHFSPYFKLASRGVHSGAKSFDNLWTIDDDMLLIWPSNIWLADPLQNTSLFLLKSTIFILTDFAKQNDDYSNKIILLYLGKVITALEKNFWQQALEVESKILKHEFN